ncbi:MAG: hypothetical protein QOE61_5616 [Micromonosporaceae bacterium]|nr:hypothetical protein [Micromonosporaceae bacterium]
MRRIVLALLGTAICTSLLIGLKTQVAMTQLGLSAATPADAGAGGDPATGQPGASSAAAGPSAATAAPSAAASTTAPTAKALPSATAGTGSKPPTATATKTTAPAPASRTVLGTAVAAKDFGNMQVKIVVTGTHIDDIVTVQKSSRPLSVSTTLRTQALNAQSSNVGNVSGATYSSAAYKQSLQNAIAKM